MNLFVVGFSPGGIERARGARALEELLGRLPFLAGRTPQSWLAPSGCAALAWVAHAPEQTGGVEYVVTEPDRFALFAGRPFIWTSDAEADGRTPLDPRFYLDDIPGDLDGRWAAVRYDDRERQLEVACDATGAYPLHEAEVGEARWVSNNPELVRAIADEQALDPAVLASVLGGGWSLTGDPPWRAVKRVPHTRGELERRSIGKGLDTSGAAARLTAAVLALADWPGRPNVVPLTGGRDSRVVLAAALAAGLDFETTTGAVEGSPDVAIARSLAQAAGVPHGLIADDPHGSVAGDWRRAAELIALTAAGTSSLSDAAGYPFGPRPGALPLWHSGQGGEVARSYYGSGDGLSRDALVDRLYRAFVGRRPGRAELLSAAGAAAVRGEVARFVDAELERGAAPVDVPDLFYLERRMGTWAGPTHGCVEYVRDTTSPLWSRVVVRDELSLDAAERAAERFHVEMLRGLAPALLAIPYEDGTLPGARSRPRASFARKVERALRRRLRAAVTRAPDPFDATLAEIREVVLSQPDHPAWEVLDRTRVEGVLAGPAARLDVMSRYYAWRLATVFTLTVPSR